MSITAPILCYQEKDIRVTGMRGNEAQCLIAEDQLDGEPMEARIARIESDVAHMKSDISNIQIDIRELRKDMKAANDSISKLESGLAALAAIIDAKINALEAKMIKWIIGTIIAVAGLAFSIAKFVH